MEGSSSLRKFISCNDWSLGNAKLQRFFEIVYNLGEQIDWDKKNLVDVSYMFWHLQYGIVAGVGFGLSATNAAEVVGDVIGNKDFATSGSGIYLKSVLFAVAFVANTLLQLTFYKPLWELEYFGKKSVGFSLLSGLLVLAVTPLFFPIAASFVYPIAKYLVMCSDDMLVQKFLTYYLLQFRAGMFANMLVLGSMANLAEVNKCFKDRKETKDKQVCTSILWTVVILAGLGVTYVMSIGPGKGLQGKGCDSLANSTDNGVMQAMFFNNTHATNSTGLLNQFMVGTLCDDNIGLKIISYLAYHRFASGMAKNFINGFVRSWKDFPGFLLKWSFLPLTTGALIVSDVVAGVNPFSLIATVVGGLFINEAGVRNLVLVLSLLASKLRKQVVADDKKDQITCGGFIACFVGLVMITLGAALPMSLFAGLFGLVVYGFGSLSSGGCCKKTDPQVGAGAFFPGVGTTAVVGEPLLGPV
jgi:hypothetical protein